MWTDFDQLMTHMCMKISWESIIFWCHDWTGLFLMPSAKGQSKMWKRHLCTGCIVITHSCYFNVVLTSWIKIIWQLSFGNCFGLNKKRLKEVLILTRSGGRFSLIFHVISHMTRNIFLIKILIKQLTYNQVKDDAVLEKMKYNP